jgi:hypothetical protein
LGEVLGPLFGENQFENIVRFMAGRSPSECDLSLLTSPGTEKCIARVRRVNAVATSVTSWPTDPTKAPPGSIRRELAEHHGNAAHASDSVENARREMRIVNVGEDPFLGCRGSRPALNWGPSRRLLPRA